MSESHDGLIGYGVAAGIAAVVLIALSSGSNQNRSQSQDGAATPYTDGSAARDPLPGAGDASGPYPKVAEDRLGPDFTFEEQALTEATTIHRVALTSADGVLEVPVTINGLAEGNFTLDSGASVVVLSKELFVELIRKGGIKKSDYLGTEKYSLADGSIMESPVFTIKKLMVGDVTVRDIRATVTGEGGGLLLGQSFLRRFKSWHVDNDTNELVVEM